jgi:hypothetical protein
MAELAQQRVRQLYDWDALACKLEAVWLGSVQGHGSSWADAPRRAPSCKA